MRVCADDPNLNESNWDHHVRSIKLPPRTKVVLYTE